MAGAHTLGRAYPSRSGFGKESTKYTADGPGTKGGESWTPEWLKFDNSYFVEVQFSSSVLASFRKLRRAQ
jgi:L-ascorbate peroxidase